MAFQPSSSNFTKTRLAISIVALVGTCFLALYHVRQARIAEAFLRPALANGGAGPAILEGPVGGTTFKLPTGTNVLLAQIEVWDRPPTRKGATVVCRRVLAEQLTIAGRSIAWDLAAQTSSTDGPLLSRKHVGYLDVARTDTPIPASKLGGFCDAEAARRANTVIVRTILPGDTVTALGCAQDGNLVPCRDGYDLLSSRPRLAAATAMRQGLLGLLFLAMVLGVPSLFALIVLLSHRTASVARPASRAVS